MECNGFGFDDVQVERVVHFREVSAVGPSAKNASRGDSSGQFLSSKLHVDVSVRQMFRTNASPAFGNLLRVLWERLQRAFNEDIVGGEFHQSSFNEESLVDKVPSL